MKFRIAATVAAFVAATSSHAAIIGFVDPDGTNTGSVAQIIGAPSSVLEDLVENSAQQGFDERQNVELSRDIATDQGTILEGTLVSSHMIFLNTDGNARTDHYDVTWLFDGDILGIMSDYNGNLESATSDILGAVGTNYDIPSTGTGAAAPFAARGLEQNQGCSDTNTNDGYSFLGNALTLCMAVTEPGDWIRVVTAATPVPVPAALPLLLAGLGGLGLMARRKRA